MITKEKLIHHNEHLKEKHQRLNAQIDHMEEDGHFVDEELIHLKKKRLALRDEIEHTEQRIKNFP